MESESTLDSLSQQFKELMEIEGVPWIVYTAGLICLVLVAIYVVGLVRDLAVGGFSSGAEQDLDLIREIRNRDMIADEEFDKAKQLIRDNPLQNFSPQDQSPEDRHSDQTKQ